MILRTSPIKDHQLKIIHLPTAVGGNPSGLSRYLNQLGSHSECWILVENKFGYTVDGQISKERNFLLFEFDRLMFFVGIIMRYNIVHYNYGMTLFENPRNSKLSNHLLKLPFSLLKITLLNSYLIMMAKFEFLILKFFGLKIFVHFQGDDARLGYGSKYDFEPSLQKALKGSGYYSFHDDCFKKRKFKKFNHFSNGIYCLNPDLKWFLPKRAKFIPYCQVPISDIVPCFPDANGKNGLKVGHAPSHRGVKGTDIILRSLENLQKRGYIIDIVLIENVSNQQAMELYKGLDLVVDQLFAGWYGGLAVECMALGKPVVSYIREQDLQFIPKEMAAELPVISANPEDVEKKLEMILLMDRLELRDLGIRSRKYVEKWHDPEKIAKQILDDYLSC